MMECADLGRRLQPLLDDLLQEDEYLACHAHLAACARCRDHVASVNSLAYGVAALGQVEPPGDLLDAVAFRLKQAPSGTLAAPPARRNPAWVAAGAVVLAAAAGSVWYHTSRHRGTAPRDDGVRVHAELARSAPTDREAELALTQLKAIAGRLGVEIPAAQGDADSNAVSGDGSPEAPLVWRLRLRPSEQAAVLQSLDGSGAVVEHQVPGMLLLSAPGPAVQALAERIQAMPGALAEGDRLELGGAGQRAGMRIVIELTGSEAP